MPESPPKGIANASQLITNMIAELGDWRGELIARLRAIILAASPEIAEEWKWGTAVWVHTGMLCNAGAFKDHVKLNFFKGASLSDPAQMFNAGLDAKASRGIDFFAGDSINEAALKDLIHSAIKHNQSTGKKK